METLIELNRVGHVALGFLGLAAFWVPIVTRKGARAHRLSGRVFAWCAYLVSISALASALLRTGGGWARGVSPFESPERYAFLFFLAYIGVVTFTAARHGMTVLAFKADPQAAGTRAHRALAWANIAASVSLLAFTALVRPETWAILLALSFIGLLQGRGILRYVSRPAVSPRAWLVEHLSAMLAAGIAFHTAFAVFGATRFFGLTLTGPLAVLPWILPALLGIPATILWSRKYAQARS